MANYILGIDVSNNNGSIDFSGMGPNDGVKIVYLKATEGQSFKDSTMSPFYLECKANGLKVGAYHFLVGTSSPEAQAQNFYSMIKDYEWDCLPMLDVETNFDGLANYVTRFINTFKQLSPLKLGIYSYTSFLPYLRTICSEIKDIPFWEANYNNDPWNLSDTFFANRIGHQYTEKGIITGITSEGCDLDSFTDGVYLNSDTIPGEWKLESNGKWWYKHEDGSYTKNGWEHINGEWYLFDSEGYMCYSWKKDGNNWYFLGGSNDGTMKYGWVLTDNKWYYFGDKNDGAMKTGWQQIDGKWYYFNTDGAMQTGWIADNSKLYCCYSSGEMICNCDLYGYHFNENGEAAKLS
ncbi:GH25 family lysozyme [Clostridium beijerinckii]|jgi:Lyzozyme M1 (1,4-beta-N-acetylmuramidase)|uniref:GH25 family lysozyme n=1 Tax=Clostridium beijerinckii TaxID=1520 RepID=UPI001361299E|nr:GH25 family lysozyme [Clostridium beijerinckii]MZK51884.1 glycoside hydrolase [Clostridium beijerinckii]MZK58501.1 glycoside hydrolase [Clostridium beijerinckii]MZK68849.1 glycoside hydrolase [Clostridium beijerinckii]MZK74220.1 glycoside hydrolase [Clostridium beijerinckii]MZK83921.1 glycoside hydrolase [Clostridium beijerinckii]